MKRFLLLARVLRKCGKGNETGDSQANMKGDNTLVLYVLGALIIPALLFFGGRFLGELSPLIGGVEAFASAVFMVFALMTLILSVMELLGTLFLTSDLPYLLSLPFSPRQIVLARTMNTMQRQLIINTLCILPFWIGFAAGSPETLTAGYWAGMVLGDLLMSVAAVAIAAILVILIMTVFRFARNREVMAVIGGLIAFAVLIAYNLFVRTDTTIDSEAVKQTAGAVINVLKGPSVIIPVIPFIAKAMTGSAPVVNLLLAVLITAAVCGLFILVADRLYLRSALNMQDSSAKKKSMDEKQWDKTSRARSAMMAYTVRDLKCVFRNPAYLVYGWLLSLAWPVLIASLFLVGSKMNIPLSGAEAEGAETMLTMLMMFCSTAVALLSACATTGLSCLASSIISREGKSFYYMKMVPVPYSVQVLGKRNAALFVAGIGSIGYELIAGIVLLIKGIVRVEWFLYCIVLTAALLILLINLLAGHDLKKPNLNWDSESSVARSNNIGVIIWIAGFILAAGVAILPPVFLMAAFMEKAVLWSTLIVLALLVLCVTGAVLSERHLYRTAAKRLKAIDA
ncbi:MAG: hypothetical protein Q4G19_02540 [Clostridia bacterium]|nr:hypothetical protein [Clostridia bacterium]